MYKKMTILIAALSALTGCASIVSGTHQPVSVHTGSATGAMCRLENDKGTWYVSNTPNTIVINRSFNDLRINCEKKGYQHSYKQVSSSTKPMVFGNIIFGGIIGAGVDVADGAAYSYPSNIFVPMRRA